MQQSSKVTPLTPPDQPPRVLANDPRAAKPNPHTPTLKTPRSSQIAAAVIDCAPLVPRSVIAEKLPHYLAEKVRACGEPDPAGDPHEQFFDSLVVLAAINYGRKVHGITDPLLIKAEGQEAAHFVHQSERAGVEVEL